MDKRQLQIFRQVAISQSFTKAALELHMAQPAVSIAVKKLEDELATPLFNRIDRRIGLTAAGEKLLFRAERILSEFQQAKDELRELEALKSGQVRLDTPAMLGSYYLPEKLIGFRQAYPGIDLHITAEGTQRAEQMLLDGSTDMAIVNVRQHSELIESSYLLREEVVLCMALDHPFAEKTAVDFHDIKDEPLLVYHQGYHLRQILNHLEAKSGHKANIIVETDILRLMVNMVASGQGMCLCLRRLVEEEQELLALPFHEPQYIEMGMGWKKGGYLSPANRAFVNYLIGEAEGIQ
ncbi:LysR family transcriptional regulator [Pseudoteredinibacter isoporae]|uniref:DNA-binding transcriptional LysR family regulator n=1 Tax=Pseudoteredinibacter isoporae TaxID=570281 RepID=A0A7X0JT04_9GAMM|nr:LysR family transcriptional regulator [Pseudoteredinibacter isoporae]MBB6520776.1 DNA-binding transcriptional LysR family regulator [Pseudoteredinibacter isoporae]NHO86342.1 LysR family transcriptional regulator [Pseudoteredinibacter isoporae]NIB25206.1 LysR family transcriptional regulator [Pseudoteredinibacter isoporae]